MKRFAMINNNLRAALTLAAFTLLAACGGQQPAESGQNQGVENAGEDVKNGTHGGRLLEDGEFALEVTIFERGVPPEFRLYAYNQGKLVAPAEVAATIELERVDGTPGGQVDQHAFTPREDYLVSAAEVYEPHSFEVNVSATHAGKTHTWHYDSPEGKVKIAAAVATSQGIQTALAGAGSISESVALYGRIQPNAERLRAVTARFAGPVQSVAVQVGDTVRAGQVLAMVESNESLRSYAVTAPIAGTVVKRNVNAGETAADEPLFEIADFSTVWAELSVFPRERTRVKSGQAVEVMAADGIARGAGRIGYVSPVGTASQALVARVVLDNAAGEWTPGQFVNARITVAQAAATLVVPLTALQSFRDWDVVAVVDADHYQLQPVELGRRDATQAEVLAGLAPGARIVVGNSYLIKADVEKSGASHDH